MNYDSCIPVREIALSECPVKWLVERHAQLINNNESSTIFPLAVRVEIESIEDELIDRDTMGELNRTKRLDKNLWDRAQAIVQRGANR